MDQGFKNDLSLLSGCQSGNAWLMLGQLSTYITLQTSKTDINYLLTPTHFNIINSFLEKSSAETDSLLFNFHSTVGFLLCSIWCLIWRFLPYIKSAVPRRCLIIISGMVHWLIWITAKLQCWHHITSTTKIYSNRYKTY